MLCRPSAAPAAPVTCGFGVAANADDDETASAAAINTASDIFFMFTFRK